MSNFRPLRASPLLRPTSTRPARDTNPLQDSRSSSVSVPELVGLTPQEIEFIDAVIERAPITATTFLTVLKVYNDVLQERGLDPQNEVVYFGKLLKLGTVKGKNWKEKWEIVKSHHGYRATTQAAASAPPPGPPTFTSRFRRPDPDIDTFTLDSHPDDTELAPSTYAESETGDAQYHETPRPTYRRPQSPTQSVATTSNSLGLDLGPPSSYPTQPKRPFGAHRWDTQGSDYTPTQVSTPPSYGAALRDPQPEAIIPSSYVNIRTRYAVDRAAKADPNPKPIVKPPLPPPSPVKERRGSVINESEAWNKVKMLRDEEDADRFREMKLVERCWDVWRQGCEWIATTNEQIAEARNTLVLRVALQRWRERAVGRREFNERVTAVLNGRRLTKVMNIWKAQLQVKRQAQWRDAMRYKMKVVRTARENKLKKDAWAKWRQSYQSHISGQHYTERLVLRFFDQWKRKLAKIDHVEAVADEFARVREDRALVRCWSLWRRTSELKGAERVMTERVDMRITSGVLHVWKRHLREGANADAFYDMLIKKRAIRAWETAQNRIRAQEHRAIKHLARKDDVLVYAIMRVWKAHERGKLLARVKSVRLLKDTWALWQKRIREQRDRENLALAFTLRPSTTVAVASLQVWRRAYVTHQNAAAFAVHYHSAQLNFKIMLAWRIRLREKLKLAKQAKIAEKFLVLRRAWKSWKTKVEDGKRDKKVKLWERAKLKTTFEQWRQLVHRQQQLKWAEDTMRQRVALTNRVADVKFRELETIQEYEQRLTSRLFKKWKAVCIRHVEELSLMQSYQDIKRAENMRKMFYRWLTAARTAQRRRVVLQLKEDEMKQMHLAIAWDKWRERFQERRLQPVADDFILQRRKNLVFFAFGLWHSKTRSLPALRFHASHNKEKFWKVWRNAMPRALQSKEARDMDRRAVLAKTFEKWLTTYRTKMALKAIARARYLRLPTTAPRQNIQQSRATPIPPTTKTPIYPRRAIRPASPVGDSVSEAGSSRSPFPKSVAPRSGIASLLVSKSVSPENRASRPKFSSRGSTREPSPTRSRSSYGAARRERSPPKLSSSRPPSTAGGEGGKSRLWMELREVQRKSRPPTERSRSP